MKNLLKIIAIIILLSTSIMWYQIITEHQGIEIMIAVAFLTVLDLIINYKLWK